MEGNTSEMFKQVAPVHSSEQKLNNDKVVLLYLHVC